MNTKSSVVATALAKSYQTQIAEAADQIEQERCLPDALADGLKRDGAFRALIPHAYGGLGAELPDFVEAMRIFAQVDASTAWCVTQGAVIATTSLWLPEDSAQALWSDPQCAIANGPPRDCIARPVDGGVEVTGHWGFSSGSAHATWMHGAVRRSSDDVWMGVFFEKSAATFVDNWQVAGLRGTSSQEFSVEGLVIPDEWIADFRQPAISDSTITRVPTGLVFAVSFASVALGVARAGLDVALALAQGKVPGYSSATLKEDPDMQKVIGEAEARWRSGKAFLDEVVGRVWSALANQSAITDDQRIDLRMAGSHIIREAAAVLDLAYLVAGSTAIYQSNPLQRRFQDMHVITQHVQARIGHYGYVGRYLLGYPFQRGPLN